MVRSAALLAVLVVAAATACGGTKSAATTTAPRASSAAPGFATSANCQKLAQLGAGLAQAITPGAGKAIDPARYAAALRKLADAAPAAIRDDFKTFTDAYVEFVAALKSSGYDAGSGKVPTPAQLAKLTTAARKLATPRVKAAERRLAAWGQANCTQS